MENIKIGTIVNAVALRGEVKVYHYSDYKERFEELDQIYVEEKHGMIAYGIDKVRYQNDMVILKLKGIDDRTAAEKLKQKDVFITEADLRELPEDTFYVRDLIGCQVIEKSSGKIVGKIVNVLQNTAQDIYQVGLENGKEALIPAVAQFVKRVDIPGKKVEVELIPGFLDDDGIRIEESEKK